MFTKVSGLMLAAALLAAGAADRNVFDLRVERIRILRDQPGTLHIDAQKIAFRSGDGKTIVTIPSQDLRAAYVADRQSLRFETYEIDKWNPIERRQYKFRAQADAPVEELARFLAGHVYRPVVGHYAEASQFQVPAFHRRAFGGTNGTLEIGDKAICFAGDKQADSRTWRYGDIETIGQPDSFRFRVTTHRETYVLELKSELSEAAYRFAWSKVYKGVLGEN